MAVKKIVILKKGTFTDKSGKQVVVDDKRLDAIVKATHNLQDDDFPITIGHPEGSAPAWGWINKNQVEREGDTIVAFAEEKKLHKKFLGWLKERLYKKVSVGLRKDNALDHLAFLGAAGPAVKGLPVTQFSEGDELVEIELSEAEFEFAEFEMSKWWFRTFKRFLRASKNQLIEDKNLEAADKIYPENVIEELGNPPYIFHNKPREEVTAAFSEEDKNLNIEEEMDPNKEKTLQAKIESLTAENNQLKTDKDAAVTKLSETEAAAKRIEHETFLNSEDVKLKVKPADKEKILTTLCELDNLELIEFSEGEGEEAKPVKVSVLDTVKELIKNQPDVVELSELGTKGKAKVVANSEVAEGEAMADSVNKKR